MKFPRNIRLLRSPFDVAPFAAVFFILVIFVLLSALMPVPGLPLQLPAASDLPGTDKATVSVAVAADGRFYYENQVTSEARLKSSLTNAVKNSREPITLVIQADKTVTYDQLVHLTMLARDTGIRSVLLATLPRLLESPAKP